MALRGGGGGGVRERRVSPGEGDRGKGVGVRETGLTRKGGGAGEGGGSQRDGSHQEGGGEGVGVRETGLTRLEVRQRRPGVQVWGQAAAASASRALPVSGALPSAAILHRVRASHSSIKAEPRSLCRIRIADVWKRRVVSS